MTLTFVRPWIGPGAVQSTADAVASLHWKPVTIDVSLPNIAELSENTTEPSVFFFLMHK